MHRNEHGLIICRSQVGVCPNTNMLHFFKENLSTLSFAISIAHNHSSKPVHTSLLSPLSPFTPGVTLPLQPPQTNHSTKHIIPFFSISINYFLLHLLPFQIHVGMKHLLHFASPLPPSILPSQPLRGLHYRSFWPPIFCYRSFYYTIIFSLSTQSYVHEYNPFSSLLHFQCSPTPTPHPPTGSTHPPHLFNVCIMFTGKKGP